MLEPVVATKLRFIVDDGVTVNGNTCWGLFLLGCTLTEGTMCRSIIRTDLARTLQDVFTPLLLTQPRCLAPHVHLRR